MKWVEIRVTTIPEAVEAISGILYDVGVGGLYIQDPADLLEYTRKKTDWDYISDELKNTVSNEVIIRAYILKDKDAEKRISLVKEKLNEVHQYFNEKKISVEIGYVQEKDWSENWKKYYKPLKITDKLIVKPTWEHYERQKENEIVIEMNPGMAFGTGLHETTKMCMQMLECYIKQDSYILDIGCGSGILGIAALKLGAKACVGVDIDSKAIKIARENAKINGVYDRMKFKTGNLLNVVSGRYDIIVANIVADVIIALSEMVSEYLNPDGIFIASGIIRERYDEVKACLLKRRFNVINELFMGEWASISVKPKDT